MEDSNNKKKNQTHIRVLSHLKRRLDKISKDSGKTLNNVTTEILKLGIETYYKEKEEQ